MVLRVGIDEAGYGPLLGPLVVAATVWRVPDADAERDLWDVLARAVRRTARGADARLAVCDSKDLFDQKHGLGTLERQVRAFLSAADMPCDSLAALLGSLARHAGVAFQRRLPWYRDLNAELPRDRVHGQCDAAAALLRRTLNDAGVSCAGILAEVVSEDAFNERVSHTQNKASVVVEQVLRLIHRTTRMAEAVDAHVVVDRLGGRANYRNVLMQAFPERDATELECSETLSRYRLSGGGAAWTISFEIEAEQRHLPVALASMTAKYVRELLMEQFNRWWRTHQPALRPTAGYYTDAQRFLGDIAASLPQCGIPTDQFVRSR